MALRATMDECPRCGASLRALHEVSYSDVVLGQSKIMLSGHEHAATWHLYCSNGHDLSGNGHELLPGRGQRSVASEVVESVGQLRSHVRNLLLRWDLVDDARRRELLESLSAQAEHLSRLTEQQLDIRDTG